MYFLRIIFFTLIIRPIILIVLGLNIRYRDRLSPDGPAIIVANHNSHLDTLTLMSLWPLARVFQVRPVAAADYFLTNAKLAWFSLNIMHIIPIDRNRKDKESDPLAEPSDMLAQKQIVLLFPEGSRGEPERLSRFKSGVARLLERHPETPLIPVFMHGLGKALPRGDFLLVPFFVDVVIGEPIYWRGSVNETMGAYERAMHDLAQQVEMPAWE